MKHRRDIYLKRPTTRRRRGAAILEAALVMSTLMMLSFGAVEYGYAFYVKHVIQQACYVGVRSAISTGSTNTTVQSAVASSLTTAGFSANSFTVTTSPASVAGLSSGTNVTLTISCAWGNVGITPLPNSMGGIPSTKQFTCSAVMVHE